MPFVWLNDSFVSEADASISLRDTGLLHAAGVFTTMRSIGGRVFQLDAHLARVFGDERAAEGEALASRAPLDLRVNTLKATHEEAAEALSDLRPEPTRWSPLGLRIALTADSRNPAIHAEPAFIKGLVEVQDEGSQLIALLTDARPGQRVCDLCAGAGGKT